MIHGIYSVKFAVVLPVIQLPSVLLVSTMKSRFIWRRVKAKVILWNSGGVDFSSTTCVHLRLTAPRFLLSTFEKETETEDQYGLTCANRIGLLAVGLSSSLDQWFRFPLTSWYLMWNGGDDELQSL